MFYSKIKLLQFKINKTKDLFTSLFLLITIVSFGQLNNQIGTPFVKNFTKKQVKKDLKIFDISQDKNGELYFANPGYLLEYDGFSWKNFPLKTNLIFGQFYIRMIIIFILLELGGLGFGIKTKKGI